MALPATDSFTDSNGTALTTHDASWTLCKGNFAINSNAVYSNSGGEGGAGWNADAFNANQYSEVTFVAETVGTYGGPAVRCDDDTPDDYYYGFYSDSVASYLFKVINGAWTQLGNSGASWAINDVIRLEVDGVDPGTITPKVNGATLNPPNAQNDSDIDAGSAGITGYLNNTGTRIDDWEGGNLGAAGGTPLYVNLSGLPRATIA